MEDCRLNEFKKKVILQTFKKEAKIEIKDWINYEGYITIISVKIGKLTGSIGSDVLNKERTKIIPKNFERLKEEIKNEINNLKKGEKIENGGY